MTDNQSGAYDADQKERGQELQEQQQQSQEFEQQQSEEFVDESGEQQSQGSGQQAEETVTILKSEHDALLQDKAMRPRLERALRNKKNHISNNHKVNNQQKTQGQMSPSEQVEARTRANEETDKKIAELERMIQEERRDKIKEQRRNALISLQNDLWAEYGDQLNPKARRMFNRDIESNFEYDEESGQYVARDPRYHDVSITNGEWFDEWLRSDTGSLAKQEVRTTTPSLGSRPVDGTMPRKPKYKNPSRSDLFSPEKNAALEVCRLTKGQVEFREMQSQAEFLKFNADKNNREDAQRVLNGEMLVYIRETNSVEGLSAEEILKIHGKKI